MSGNEQGGTIRSTVQAEMKAYDSLPPALRAALQTAKGNHSAVSYYELIFIPIKELVESLKRQDDKYHPDR